MRCLPLMPLAAAAATMCLLGSSIGFSFAPPQSKRQCPRSSQQLLMQPQNDDDIVETHSIGTRRGFFARVAAVAPLLVAGEFFQPQPQRAFAATDEEPTRITLDVETEYLLRVLKYFDGDMRKVLGVLVRAPGTTVEIDPPTRGKIDPKLTPKEAILEALSSFEQPDEYTAQADWVKVDEPGNLRKAFDFLTQKRYRLYLPTVQGAEGGESRSIELDTGSVVTYQKLDVSIRPTDLDLSNLEAGVALAVASYPIAYSWYNYEKVKEEENAKLKKAMMAKKRAAKAKAAAAKKGTKKDKGAATKKGGKGGAKGEAPKKKDKPAMKGQEAKKGIAGGTPVSDKKKTTTFKAKPTNDGTDKAAEDKVAAEMLDSKREKVIADVVSKAEEEKVATEMLDSKRKKVIADVDSKAVANEVAVEMLDAKREKFIAVTGQPQEEDGKEPETLVAAAAVAETSDSPVTIPERGSEAERYPEYVCPKGPFNSYLDSL